MSENALSTLCDAFERDVAQIARVAQGSEQWVVIEGDCLDYLPMIPNVSVDVVLTDPPYCSGGQLEAQRNTKAQGIRSEIAKQEGFAWFASDNMSTAGLIWLLRSMMVQANRILRPNRSTFVFTDYRMVPNIVPPLESCGMRYRNLLVWDKGHAGLGAGFKPAHELVLEFTNGSTEYVTRAGQNVLRFARVHASKKEHGAEKPVELLAAILAQTVTAGGLVVDPFAGVASTGVAALRAGARYIGIERDPRFAALARKRLEAESARKDDGAPPCAPAAPKPPSVAPPPVGACATLQ